MRVEREWGYKAGCGSNDSPQRKAYPKMSVFSTSTHDTLGSLAQWDVRNIYRMRMFDYISSEQANEKFEQYATQREALNYALTEKGCWERVGGKPCKNPRQDATKIPEKYVEAVTDYLAQGSSAIMLMPLSDILGCKEMGNIPGTQELSVSEHEVLTDIHEGKAYPNWRKKMHIPIEHMDKIQEFKDVAEIMTSYRSDGNNGKGRFYEFSRLGENKDSSINFERYQELFNRIKDNRDFEFSNIIEARYSHKRSETLELKAQKTRSHYEKQTKAYVAYRLSNYTK